VDKVEDTALAGMKIKSVRCGDNKRCGALCWFYSWRRACDITIIVELIQLDRSDWSRYVGFDQSMADVYGRSLSTQALISHSSKMISFSKFDPYIYDSGRWKL
jgi:hypothetical protein